MAKNKKEGSFLRGGEFERTLLYLYPHLLRIANGMGKGIENKAALSYRSERDTLSLLEDMLFEIEKERFLRKVASDVKGVLAEFSFEEAFALEYKYFRRKSELKKYYELFPKMAIRTFYRRIISATIRFGQRIRKLGMDERWFLENFGQFDWALRVYKKVLEGKERTFFSARTPNPYVKRNKVD